MKHRVSGEIKELDREAFLALFDPEVHAKITALEQRYPTAIGVACLENLEISTCPGAGHKSALVFGPDQTWKEHHLETEHLGDVPSRHQFPVAVWRFKREEKV
jgi:hypothetical protein